jgi:hypothetical protein
MAIDRDTVIRLTPEQRERMRQKIMAETNLRMPIISKRFNEWRDWPGTWAFADVAVAALQDEIASLVSEHVRQGEVEPAAWMWQHEETGMTGFVEHASEDELRQWERMNKPRKIICPLFRAAGVKVKGEKG